MAGRALDLHVLAALSRDGRLLFVTRTIRLFGYGLISVILVLHLAQIGLPDAKIGLLLTLTLLGDTAISLWITTTADRIGRNLVRNEAGFARNFAGETKPRFRHDFAEEQRASNERTRSYASRRKNEAQRAHTPPIPPGARAGLTASRAGPGCVCAGSSFASVRTGPT